jgi:hypothetical protein
MTNQVPVFVCFELSRNTAQPSLSMAAVVMAIWKMGIMTSLAIGAGDSSGSGGGGVIGY